MEDLLKQYLAPGKKNIILIYMTFLAGLINILLPIIGACLAFKHLEETNKYLRGHYIFAFRTFCISAVAAIIMAIFTFIGFAITYLSDLEIFAFIGGLGALAVYYFVFVWVVVRSIIAIQYVVEDKEHPNSLTFGFK